MYSYTNRRFVFQEFLEKEGITGFLGERPPDNKTSGIYLSWSSAGFSVEGCRQEAGSSDYPGLGIAQLSQCNFRSATTVITA